jgi:hypothetical protein
MQATLLMTMTPFVTHTYHLSHSSGGYVSNPTVAQVREAMIGTSERKGRVNLIHPRHAAQALGITLSP